MRQQFSRQLERAKWRVMDGLIGIKRRLPRSVYQSPPSWVGYLFLVPGILLISLLFVGMLLLTYYSFLTFDSIEFIVYEFTLENWQNLLETPAYLTVFARTLVFAALITVVSIAFALPYSYLTIRVQSPLLRKLLLVGIFVPFFTGTIVRAYGWLIILGQNGLLNYVFGLFGLGPYQFIATELGVAIGLLQIMAPFAIIMIAPAVENVDRSLELAASNLGANPFQTFRHVVIPLINPGIAGATIVVFTITSATYAIPDLIGGGRVDFIANVIYRALFSLTNYPLASVFSVTLVLITSVVVLAIFRTLGSGTLGMTGGDGDE